MSKTLTSKHASADRARFLILKSDIHLAGLCSEIRHETNGRRSQAVLTLAEAVLSGAYDVQPLTMDAISELSQEGGVAITTHLTKTSRRFPLVLKELEGCEGFKARGDRLKAIIEKPYLTALSRQLEHGANGLNSKPKSQLSQEAIKQIPQDLKLSDTSNTTFSFVSTKPQEPSKSFNAQKTLAMGLMDIAQ